MLLLQMAAGLMVVEGVAEEQCVHLKLHKICKVRIESRAKRDKESSDLPRSFFTLTNPLLRF